MIEYLFSLEWNKTGNKLVIFVIDMEDPTLIYTKAVYSSQFIGTGVDAAPLKPSKILEVLYA